MNIVSHIALLGFPLFGLLLYLNLSPRQATIWVYLIGWLFLPQAGYVLSGVPDYGKSEVVAVTAFLGVMLFDPQRFLSFRMSWIDVPIVVFCLCPFATHVVNGFGPVSGMNWVISHACLWGMPYYWGRVYFNDANDIQEFAIAIFLAGLLYVPFCLYEIRMSPHLHRTLYGFMQHSFAQHVRYGGFRPLLFMQHGIMVGTWMVNTTLVGLILWRTKVVTRVSLLGFFSIPMNLLVPLMLTTTILCKVGSAVGALCFGLAVLVANRFSAGRIALVILALLPPSYIFSRTTGIWTGKSLTTFIGEFDKERAGSLAIRMYQEDVIASHASRRMVFGYGNGDFMPKNEQGKNLARGNDGFWIITYGMYGLTSLSSCFMALMLPAILVAYRSTSSWERDTNQEVMTVLAIVVSVFAIDCLVNSMINPIYIMSAGAISSASFAMNPSSYDDPSE